VVLRFSRQGRGDEEQYDEDDDDETDDVEMGRESMRMQEGEDAVEGAANGVSDDAAAQLRDKETLAEKLAGIRARLLDKQATRPRRMLTFVHQCCRGACACILWVQLAVRGARVSLGNMCSMGTRMF
jgi:hypothetical protein